MEGDGQAMVAGAGGDDAAGALGGTELPEQIGGAALLERSGHLEVLELHEALGAREIGERLGIRARRLVHGSGDSPARRLDVGQRDHQNGTTGSPSAGDIHPTGMSGVECA